MLPEEPISRSYGYIWSMWHALKHLQMAGRNWQDTLVKLLASELYERVQSQECVIWTYVADVDGKTLHYTFATFEAETGTEEFTKRAAHTRPLGTLPGGELPAGAVPVLKRCRDGRIVRLWPAPGPAIAPEQTVTVDWAKFTLSNRCYTMAE